MAVKREPLTMKDLEDISFGLAKGLGNEDITGVGQPERIGYGHTVERVCRDLCPVALPHRYGADSVKDALFDAVEGLPTHLRGSLTRDRALR